MNRLGEPTSADSLHQTLEALIYHEAALLDGWQLDAWLALLTPDVEYQVPPLDYPDAEPSNTLFMIADDRVRLESRVRQLQSATAWAENPRSRTRRLITNVLVLESSAETARANANFAVWQFQYGGTNAYVGQLRYLFRKGPDGWLIAERKAVLDMEELRPHGKISFIL